MSEAGTEMGKCLALLGRVTQAGLDIAMTESLCTFDGQPGYTLAQGQ
jgi:isocitrate dehydrogenase